MRKLVGQASLIVIAWSFLILAGCNDKSVTYITGPTNPVFGPTIQPTPVPTPTPTPTPTPSPSPGV